MGRGGVAGPAVAKVIRGAGRGKGKVGGRGLRAYSPAPTGRSRGVSEAGHGPSAGPAPAPPPPRWRPAAGEWRHRPPSPTAPLPPPRPPPDTAPAGGAGQRGLPAPTGGARPRTRPGSPSAQPPSPPRPAAAAAPPRRRRRRRSCPAPPAFLVHETPDDILLVLPGGGAAPRPPRPPTAPRLPRRREAGGGGGSGGAVGDGGGSGPQSAWGSRLPPEILGRIFQAAVEQEGAVPFLCRAARVCRLWGRAAAQPRLWRRVSLGGRGPHSPGRDLGALRRLAANRFCLLQEFELCDWGGHVGAVLEALGQHCPLLASLCLRRCRGVPAPPLAQLPPRCPRLQRLQLCHCQVEPSAVGGFLGATGPRLQQLLLSCAPRLGTILAMLAGGCCPELRLLELDTALGGAGPPLPLPVEELQVACPHLQVLRLLNLSWAPRQRRRLGPGFPRLEELSLAGTGGTGVSDEVLGRVLCASGHLRLLDLRGCTRVTPQALLQLPCPDLEQLYLGLPCGVEQLPRVTEGSAGLVWRWHRSLRELDLAGRSFSEEDLARALAAFGPGSPLRSLNLAGTKVTAGALSTLLPACPHLAFLNLAACRCLPRGTKRAHRGVPEVRHCLQLLGGHSETPLDQPPPDQLPPDQPPGEDPLGQPLPQQA
ncbi:F-box/LRR-repeat protein 6 isoform X2 [Falco biarmicus]|uniref:F-box/LRR-repeat protein 6 isoform X2 n=1 Tax=Falco biarmicus TaxID=345155 RepID=UPI0024BC814E|nr:F-box/LRR-repeat protein 6 isoform X2 [Falco biarmicus]